MKKTLFLLIFLVHCIGLSYAQDSLLKTRFTKIDSTRSEPDFDYELYPNIAGKSIMTPTAWGSYGQKYIFVALGGAVPQVYADRADLIAAAGIGFGNALKAVSFTGDVEANDVSKFRNFSVSISASRVIGEATSISVGAMHLFADQNITDTRPSYYIALSHSVQDIPSFTFGYSKLNYTIGVGSGRFYQKSKRDIQFKRGRYGTAVFANVSYEIFKNVNLGAEWTGLNLCISTSWRPAYNLPSIEIGVTDLTRYSGNRPGFVFCIAHAFLFPSKNQQ